MKKSLKKSQEIPQVFSLWDFLAFNKYGIKKLIKY